MEKTAEGLLQGLLSSEAGRISATPSTESGDNQEDSLDAVLGLDGKTYHLFLYHPLSERLNIKAEFTLTDIQDVATDGTFLIIECKSRGGQTLTLKLAKKKD